MIGRLVGAYPQPCVELFILLKYVGLEGACPSAPRDPVFVFAPLPFWGRGGLFDKFLEKLEVKN